MIFRPTSGNYSSSQFSSWDRLTQSQIEFQHRIVNRKACRGKAGRKALVRQDVRDRPPRGYGIPMVPGGHRWAHYCSPQELQMWRDHILKDSQEEEGPLRCADLDLWQEILTEVSIKPVIVKSLASVEGRKLLGELSPGAVLEGGSSHISWI